MKIASAEVAHLMTQWYTYIKESAIPQAIAIKDEIEHALKNMEEDEYLLVFFQLLDFRHKLLTEEFPKSSEHSYEKIKNLEEDIKKTNDSLQYFHYFFSGQYHYYKKDFINAIRFYKFAEEKLKSIGKEIETAEFHYKIAVAYYYIKQNFFSLRHAETALDIFKAHEQEIYLTRKINCEMVLGANKFDLFRYNEAEAHYQKALADAQSIDNQSLTGKAYHNIGISYAERKLYEKAEEYLRKAISIPEHLSSRVGINSVSDLTRVLYKQGAKDEAHSFLQKGISMAQVADDGEYHAKFQLIKALYEDGDLQTVSNSSEYLESRMLWPDVEDFAQDIADYFKELKDDRNTVVYLEKVIHAKEQISKVTEELE